MTAAERPGASHGSRCGSVRVSTRTASHRRWTTPFMSKKSTSRAPPLQCSVPPLPVQAHATVRRSPALREKRVSNLEQSDVPLFAPAVVGDGVDEAGQRRRTQHREILRQRICDRNEITLARKWSRGGLGHEPERHRFVESRGGEHATQVPGARDARIDRRRRGRQCRECGRQPIEPMMTRDLLDQVDLALHVDAPCRHRDVPAVLDCGGRGSR